MTDEQWEKIAPFAAAKAEADQRMVNLSLANTQFDQRKAAEAAVNYLRAKEEQKRAADGYEKALRDFAPI